MRASFLKLEMNEFAGALTLVAADGRRRPESGELAGVAVQQARDGGFGELGHTGNLEARQPAAAQSQDAGDARSGWMVVGEHWGREERFWRPVAPWARKRASHL